MSGIEGDKMRVCNTLRKIQNRKKAPHDPRPPKPSKPPKPPKPSKPT